MKPTSYSRVAAAAAVVTLVLIVVGAYFLGRGSLSGLAEVPDTPVAERVQDAGGENRETPPAGERSQGEAMQTGGSEATAEQAESAGALPDTAVVDANGQILPYPSAPACEFHDPESWHGLWNAEIGCHFNHTHNADPSRMDEIFGPYTSVTGQELSYAWQTHDENLSKHEGYKWALIENPACGVVSPNHGCIKNFRIQFHVVGTFGANFRIHSFWLEAELDNGGMIRTGGHNDFGYLCVPYKGEHVPLPQYDPESVNCDAPPYRGHARTGRAFTRGGAVYTWNSQAGLGWGNIVTSFDFQSRDDFGGIDDSDPDKLVFICPEFECGANHSTMLVYELVLNVPQADFQGFTDVQGNTASSCQEPGPDCVPLIIENAAPGTYSFRVPLRPSTPHEEFDIYFGGQPSGWIEYPN